MVAIRDTAGLSAVHLVGGHRRRGRSLRAGGRDRASLGAPDTDRRRFAARLVTPVRRQIRSFSGSLVEFALESFGVSERPTAVVLRIWG